MVVVISLSESARAWLGASSFYPLTSVAAFAAIMAVAIGTLGTNHPFRRFGAANRITTLRAGLAALVLGLTAESTRPIMAAIAAAAGLAATLLDGADGWLARRTRMASQFGARFDMEVDTLLILGLAILVWEHDKAGPWIAVSGVLRYVFVAAGAIWPWLKHPLPPSRRRQAVCVVQIVGLLIAVSPATTTRVSAPIAAVALASLCSSFLVDTFWLWRHGRAAMTVKKVGLPAFPSWS